MDFTVEKLKCGDKVHFKYVNKTNHYINGVVKSIPENSNYVFIVYHCNEDWDNYQNYTAASTSIENISKGWK